jgi:hypothetical protein
MKRTNENYQYCEHIAETLKKYALGCYRCPGCGQEFDDEGECPTCEEDLEPQSLYDYFADALDIEYRVGSDREYRSCKILVAFGGPNIWIDTEKSKVILQWWTEHAEAEIDEDTNDAINELFEELYNC